MKIHKYRLIYTDKQTLGGTEGLFFEFMSVL